MRMKLNKFIPLTIVNIFNGAFLIIGIWIGIIASIAVQTNTDTFAEKYYSEASCLNRQIGLNIQELVKERQNLLYQQVQLNNDTEKFLTYINRWNKIHKDNYKVK